MKKNEYFVTFSTEAGHDVGFYTRSTNVAKAIANAQKEYYRQDGLTCNGPIVEVTRVEKFLRDLKVPSKKAVRKVHG